jgi:hypothetical protein
VAGGGGARTTADPPFDFAQGRLFGDDNQKGKANAKAKVKAKQKTKAKTKYGGSSLRSE